jgi:hypothetical protein
MRCERTVSTRYAIKLPSYHNICRPWLAWSKAATEVMASQMKLLLSLVAALTLVYALQDRDTTAEHRSQELLSSHQVHVKLIGPDCHGEFFVAIRTAVDL